MDQHYLMDSLIQLILEGEIDQLTEAGDEKRALRLKWLELKLDQEGCKDVMFRRCEILFTANAA